MRLHERWLISCHEYSERVAIKFGSQTWTYAQLEERSNQFAHALLSKNVSPDDVVAVSLPRSLDLIAALLGVLKVGAAYLPLDESYPADRLNYMVEKAQARCRVSLEEGESCVTPLQASLFASSNVSVSAGSRCYVIFTSGSTGRPKGVCMGHAALDNLIVWQNQQTPESSVTLQYTPVSFDVHFQEIFATLTTGGTLVLISDPDRKNPAQLMKVLQDQRVDRLLLPFVALNQLAEFAVGLGEVPRSLRDVITAGEQLKITPAIRQFFLKSGARLHNHYGPSETHVVTALTLNADPLSWTALPSIGFPVANCEVQLLEGELYLGGICLAEGYIHDPELTAERFVQHPIHGRMYRTGDFAELLENGEINYLGRRDGQLKIRGHRVEIAEVEVQLNTLGYTAAVKVFEDQNLTELCAFIVGDTHGLREKMLSSLPHYLIPKMLVSVPALPLTPSGKVDYRALEIPKEKSARRELTQEYRAPISAEEKTLCELFANYLNVSPVGVDDSFFLLGGNSLLAIKLMNEANQKLKMNWSPMRLFDRPTVAQLLTADEATENEVKSLGGDIAIVAMTGRFPGARSVGELWSKLLTQETVLTRFNKIEASVAVDPETLNDANFVNIQGRYPGEREFDAAHFSISPREAELMDPQQRKFLELAYEALELAGLTPGVKRNVGVFAGMGNTLYGEKLRQHAEKVKDFGEFNVMLGNEKDYIATRLAHKLNLTGPAVSVHTGCSTSLVAIIQAVGALRLGQCDVALAGGISIAGSEPRGHVFQPGGILSQDGVCRPFDASATGTIFTDGGGVLVLKRLSDAEKAGDNIWAVIRGVGINNDGADKMSFTAPSLEGQVQAILAAQRDAGVKASEIEYVEAHGTATPVGDPIEVAALKRAFERNGASAESRCVISSLKSNLGHLTAAAGVGGVIKAALSIHHNLIPGIANFKKLNPAISELKTSFVFSPEHQRFQREQRLAGVSSFGVGGTNAHIVLSAYHPKQSELKKPAYLLKVSAKSSEQLACLTTELEKLTATPAIAATLEKGRARFKHRAARLCFGERSLMVTGEAKHSPVALLFSGQGSQIAGMGKELYAEVALFKKVVDESAVILDQLLDRPLKTILFSEESKSLLQDTYYAQPAIFVFEYGVARALMASGVIPQALVGHSVGEFIAATLAGVFAPEDGLRLIAERARLCREMKRGSMLSLAMSLAEASQWAEKFELSVAAINGPRSIVLAGETERIDRLMTELEREGMASIKLATSHAFHSSMMLPMVTHLAAFVGQFKMASPQIPMISTVTGQFETSAWTTPEYWAQQLLRPVDFVSATQTLLQDSYVAVEVGARNVLANLVQKIRPGAAAISVASPGLTEYAGFLHACAKLWCIGPDVRVYDSVRSVAPAPTYPFLKTTYWLNDIRFSSQEVVMSHSISQKITKIFADASGVDISQFDGATSFLEMGMDSLLLTQVAVKLKKEFGQPITFRQLMEDLGSLDSLVRKFAPAGHATEVKQEVAVAAAPAPAPVSAAMPVTSAPVVTTVPAAPAPVVAPAPVTSEGLQGIVERQLALMEQQLKMLSGQPLATAAAGTTSTVTRVPTTSSRVVESAPVTAPAPSLKAKVSNAKEAFGASARITVEKTSDLSPKQQADIQKFLSDYIKKTQASKVFTQENRKNHADPRVVTGFKPEWKEIVYPIVTNKSLGQRLWDLDGNEYIDMTCGFGSNFFGNGNSHIKKLMQEQLDSGIEIGPQHPLVGEVSRLINELTGNERTAFCNTGSEAVLGAMRVARTVTGREKIVVFSGSYHGINDEVILRAGKTGQSFPAAPGINGNSVSNMIVMDYGTEETLAKIAALGDEVAAVLVEPVQSRRCDFHPVEFLQKLRALTEQNGTCLIFDEVITGFRNHPGGAQAMFGIRADLCAYGKIVGGGMPIGVISGKSAFMDALDGGHWQYGDDSTPTVGVTYFAGTFVRHPMALAAAKGALEILKQEGVAGLKRLAERSQRFVDELNLFLQLSNVPLKMDNFGSLMKPKWKQEIVGGELLFAHLRYFGVHAYDGFPWFVNLAHTEADLTFVLNAFKKSVAAMQLLGLLPMGNVHHEVNTAAKIFDANQPPVGGAILGRDEQGAPAWFLPTPSGGYNLIERQ